MSVSAQSQPPLALDAQLCFALYSTVHALGKVYSDLLPDLRLTYPQYLVMLVLWEADGIGLKRIGERLGLDSGTLTPVLKRLATAGLVTRTREPADERSIRVALTAKGKALRGKAESLPERLGCAMGLTPQKLDDLRDDLVRLRANLSAARNGADGASPPRLRRSASPRPQVPATRPHPPARSAIPRTGRPEE